MRVANVISVDDGLSRDDTAAARHGDFRTNHLLILPEQHVFSAKTAIFLELQPVGGVPLILSRRVAHLLALSAFEKNFVSHRT